jgi:hypothetical protein
MVRGGTIVGAEGWWRCRTSDGVAAAAEVLKVPCKTGGAEQLEKEQKSADGDESGKQGGARRAQSSVQ